MSGSSQFRLIAIVTALACAGGTDCARSDDSEGVSSAEPQIVVDVREDLLNRFVATTDSRVEPVRDFILGADVFGRQQTTTQTTLDVRPAEDRFAADLVLRGTTFSDTLGYTPQARAYTSGWHQFEARKEIMFPGDYLYTRRARVEVRPHIHNRAICPMGGGLPLIGPLIINIAFQRAESQRPLAESIAGRKIAGPVGDNFNREVDDELATLNLTLQRERTQWPLAARLRPDIQQFRSTETSLSYRGRFDSAHEITPLPVDAETGASRLAIHESIVADVVARSGIAGEEFVPDDLFAYQEIALHWLEEHAVPPLPSELRFTRPTGPFGQLPIRLHTEAPIEVRYQQGQLEVTLRARLQLVRDQWSPPLLMRFVYAIEMFDEYIRATPAARLVKPVDSELGADLLLIQPIIRQQLQQMLPVVHVPRTLEFERGAGGTTDGNGESVRLRVERLTIADGWLGLSVN